MPAGFTHILLAKTFCENAGFTDSESDLIDILDFALDYFQLGVIGPDLPYSQMVNPLSKEDLIADKFHYYFTNQVPLRALVKVKDLPAGEEKDQAFAFFLGFISHIVADGTIHPFVRDKVGDYAQNKAAHRKLEMRLDVLFLEHLSKDTGLILDINTAKIQDQISNVDGAFDHIAKIFSEEINNVYGESTTPQTILNWVKTMEFLFETAANEHNQYYAFIPGVSGFLYKNAEDLKKRKDEDLILKKDSAVGRPNNFRNEETHFIKDCIPNYYKKLSPIAIKAYEYVYKDGETLTDADLPAINLDTGRSIASGAGYNLDMKAEYWV